MSDFDSGIDVQILESTPNPERLVCQAARGDYYNGYVGDTEYETLMDGVVHSDRHIESVREIKTLTDSDTDEDVSPIEAKTYALLEKLFRRGHWGAFEHPNVTMAIKGASRSCMAQITRHRHASFDVQSQRYVDFSEKDNPVKTPKSLIDPEHMTREDGELELSEYTRDKYRYLFEDRVGKCIDAYEAMVADGVPKEDARFVLPIGTVVNWSMTMNATALLHIANVRSKANAQWEARELTSAVLDSFAEWMPHTAYLWDEHGPMPLTP